MNTAASGDIYCRFLETGEAAPATGLRFPNETREKIRDELFREGPLLGILRPPI